MLQSRTKNDVKDKCKTSMENVIGVKLVFFHGDTVDREVYVMPPKVCYSKMYLWIW